MGREKRQDHSRSQTVRRFPEQKGTGKAREGEIECAEGVEVEGAEQQAESGGGVEQSSGGHKRAAGRAQGQERYQQDEGGHPASARG